MDLRQEVQKHVRRYKRYRDNDQLVQSNWRSDEEDGGREQDGKFGKVYACALGAFLKAKHDGHATRVGCAANMMPEWLVDATPDFFDFIYREEGFHLKWADALYLPGGLVARANKLEEKKRAKLYIAAHKEILRRYKCQFDRSEHDSWSVWEDNEPLVCFLGKTYMDPEVAAGTIINVLDELLTKAGV